MTANEGKFFLQDILTENQCDEDIENLILYKIGNKKTAAGYQNEEILTRIKSSDIKKIKPGVRFIVKCLFHMGIYVAWPIEIGRKNGGVIAYKKDLEDMENSDNNFKMVSIDKKGTGNYAYYFKGKEGANKFVKEKLLNVSDEKA